MNEPKKLSDEEIEALLESLQNKYSRMPTPDSLEEFEQENPGFFENKKSIAAFCKKKNGSTPLQYLRQYGLVSKASRHDEVPPEALPSRGALPRPDADVVARFEHEVAPQEGLLENCGQDIRFDSFECNLNTQQMDKLIKAFGMLRVGDYVKLETYGPWGVEASFCDKTIGYIENAESAKHSLTSRIRHASSWGLLGGKVYAKIIGFRAVKRKNVKRPSPQAVLFVTCAMDPSKQNVVDGMLLSSDSRCLVGFAGEGRQDVVVPEGVEEIVDWAFYEQDISSVKLPESLRVIGEEAFAKTRIERVGIPRGVEGIGLRAFTRGLNRNEPGVIDPRRWEDDGPAYFEVAEGNDRYSSDNGCLIEFEGKKRILKSVYYECPGGKTKEVSIPKGVTILGEGCLVYYAPSVIGFDSYLNLKIVVPEGVAKIEDDWSGLLLPKIVSLPSSFKMSKKLKERLQDRVKIRP